MYAGSRIAAKYLAHCYPIPAQLSSSGALYTVHRMLMLLMMTDVLRLTKVIHVWHDATAHALVLPV